MLYENSILERKIGLKNRLAIMFGNTQFGTSFYLRVDKQTCLL